MVELQQFISETLVQIVAGVKDAQTQVEELGGMVHPSIWQDDPTGEYAGKIQISKLREVNFDVAVTTSETAGKKGGLGVFVGAVGIGAQAEGASTNSAISRIQFSVLLGLPHARQNV